MEVGSEVVREGTGVAAARTADEPQALAWLVLGLCLLYVVARLVWLEADPPLFLPAGQPGRDIVVEPIAKATEARSYALFGRWSANAADNYQFWRLQAPAWVYPLAGWLKL